MYIVIIIMMCLVKKLYKNYRKIKKKKLELNKK